LKSALGIGTYLFEVIWSMYSSDRMKTLIIIFKTYDKNIVFRDCQMYIFNIYFEKKRRFFKFCSVILLNFLPKINRF